MANAARISRATLVFYALPAFALAIPTVPVFVFLPTFYADNLGLGLATTGVILLIARVLDVVTDPLVGILSDTLPTRWGRRRPWIVVGGLLAAGSIIMLFQPPPNVGSAYLATWSILLYLGWTLVIIPYTAWGAELSGDYAERVRITGAREALMLAGILAAAGVPAVAVQAGWTVRDSLAAIAWLAVLCGTPAVALLVSQVDESSTFRPLRTPIPDRRAWWIIFGNRPFLRLLTAWFFNGFANGIPAVLFLLFMEHVLGADEMLRGAFIFGYFACAIAAIPVWVWLAGRLGKHRTWCCAMAAASMTFIWVPLLGAGDFIAFAAVCLVTGCALGADLALPPAIQADVVDLDTLRSGRDRAGIYFSIWGMATKFSLAAAVGISFPLLASIGFDPKQNNSGTAILALAVIYAVPAVVFKLMAITLVWGHPLDARRQRIVRRRLNARAARCPRAAS